MMESIGDFFRHVRETKGLTLDDVASKTRIHPDFLIALEEGNFTKLPDQVFAKGFVRSYARSLGLDEDDAMRRFEGSAGVFYDKQAAREQLRQQQAEDERRRKTNRKVVAAATGVAMLGLILLITREQSSLTSRHLSTDSSHTAGRGSQPTNRTEKKETALVERAEKPMDGADPIESRTMLSSQTTAHSIQPDAAGPLPPSVGGDAVVVPAPAELLSDGPMVLDLEALELTWVVVQVDGGSPLEALLRPGERVRWKGSDRFMLTLGNAGGVRVELNGKVQGPFGSTGKVARDIVLKRS